MPLVGGAAWELFSEFFQEQLKILDGWGCENLLLETT